MQEKLNVFTMFLVCHQPKWWSITVLRYALKRGVSKKVLKLLFGLIDTIFIDVIKPKMVSTKTTSKNGFDKTFAETKRIMHFLIFGLPLI